MVKLKCQNPACNYLYEITKKELENNPQYHRTCIVCGSQLKVDNLAEIVEKDLQTQAELYINKWIKELGAEGCIELVERNKNTACYRIYKDILEKRGFKLKGEKYG